MVKHVVMWELKDKETKPQVAAEMKKRLEALVGVVPGLLKAEVNMGFAGADVILYTELESREALAVYADHPAHCEVKKYVHSVICARTACDWDA